MAASPYLPDDMTRRFAFARCIKCGDLDKLRDYGPLAELGSRGISLSGRQPMVGDPGAPPFHPVLAAFKACHMDVCRYLTSPEAIAAGADVGVPGDSSMSTPLQAAFDQFLFQQPRLAPGAVGEGQAAVLYLLDTFSAEQLNVGNRNARGRHAFVDACASGDLAIVRRMATPTMLAAGVEPGRAADSGVTPIMAACAGGHRDVVDFLLAPDMIAAGVDVNYVGGRGSVLHVLARRPTHEASVQLLLRLLRMPLLTCAHAVDDAGNTAAQVASEALAYEPDRAGDADDAAALAVRALQRAERLSAARLWALVIRDASAARTETRDDGAHRHGGGSVTAAAAAASSGSADGVSAAAGGGGRDGATAMPPAAPGAHTAAAAAAVAWTGMLADRCETEGAEAAAAQSARRRLMRTMPAPLFQAMVDLL